MYVPFDQMPDNSRIWIYQADRQLTAPELTNVRETLNYFTQYWQSHGAEVTASYAILHDRFVVIAADTTQIGIGGCSIDKSVAVMQKLGELLKVNFFDRLQIAYLDEQEIKTTKLADVKLKVALGEISKQTLVFNNLISEKQQLGQQWQIPAHESFLSRYF